MNVFALLMLGAVTCRAQILQGLVDRAKQAALQAAQDKASRAVDDALNGSAGSARSAAPAASSAVAPGKPNPTGAPASPKTANAVPLSPAAESPSQGPLAPRLSFTAKLASGVRTQDFRKGLPPELADANLPERRTELANPYLPDTRRIFKVVALAPHPGGGIIFWADARYFSSTDDSEEVSGLWRMEADGRVTPFAVQTEAQFQHNRLNCNQAFDKVGVGRPDALIVEPDGNVLAAQGAHGVILRIHRNGYVERIAGGGEDWCTRNNPSDMGHRDGPGFQALFSNKIAFAQAQDGGIYVTEENANRADQLTRIRHIDARGVVTTFLTGEDCSGGHDCPPRTVGVDSIAIDRDGQLLLAAQRLGRNERGHFQGRATAHRMDPVTRQTTLLALAVDLVPSAGVPFDDFGGLALLPDGRPISLSPQRGGFVLLDGFKPTLNYWVTWSQDAPNDGPVATSSFGGKSFCVASDGSVFAVMPDRSVRRLDPVTQQVTTWLR
jgi:hypothetical protein